MTKKTTENPTAVNTTSERTETEAPEKTTDAATEVKTVSERAETVQVSHPVTQSGFCCYIGPNLKGLLQTGTVFRGTREEAYASAAKVIEAHPEVKSLIISGNALPAARIRVKTPGNILYANFHKLAKKGGK